MNKYGFEWTVYSKVEEFRKKLFKLNFNGLVAFEWFSEGKLISRQFKLSKICSVWYNKENNGNWRVNNHSLHRKKGMILYKRLTFLG